MGKMKMKLSLSHCATIYMADQNNDLPPPLIKNLEEKRRKYMSLILFTLIGIVIWNVRNPL